MRSLHTYCSIPLFVLCLLTVLCVLQPVSAQQTSDTTTTNTVATKTRPKIALVFSGGGARGGAHIGVLKVLEEQHIPVDIIVGTSSGSIVGAAYASGMKLEEIEKMMAGITTANLFRDTSRKDESFDQKSNDSLNLIGPEIGLSSQGIGLPKGVVAGVSVEAVLRRLTSRQQSQDFNKLPVPFRAVATDLATAQMVVLDHGDLAQSIRASMAIPAVVNPVEIDGRLLVDGGLARNLPVDVARQMGADVVIAVDISTPLLKRDEITSVLSVSSQILRIMTATNVEQSIKELGPQDVLITPDLGDISSADFDRLEEAAEIGEKTAKQLKDKLARYSISADNYAGIQLARTADIPKDLIDQRIDDIRVSGTSRVNPDVILATMKTRAGQDFNETKVDEDMKRIYALGDFERVGYTWTEDPNLGRILTANVVEKSWGPNYLRFGLGLSTDFEGNSYFQLMASQRWKWLNSLGGEWRNDLQFGRNDMLRSEWYQPLTPAQRIFVAARVEGARDPFDLYEDGQRIASYRRQTYDVGVDIGAPLSTVGEVRLGLTRGHVRMLNDTTPFPNVELIPSANTGGILAQLHVDTLDNMHFPRNGYKGEVSLYSSSSGLGATDDYAKISINFDAAFSYGRHSVILGVRGARGLGDNPLPDYELFSLGGFLQLSGYKTGEFLGRQVAFGRIIYNYQLTGPGFFDGTYLGASLEMGKIGDTVYTSSDTPWTHGASIYLGLDTFLGPIYLAYGRGNAKNQAVYFFLGQPF